MLDAFLVDVSDYGVVVNLLSRVDLTSGPELNIGVVLQQGSYLSFCYCGQLLENKYDLRELTVIRLELRHVVRHSLLCPVNPDVKGHERRLPEVATMKVKNANILQHISG